ncbi:Tautomerase (plasmid) [Pararobbsia alpina]|uniref:tautomerase family protein n=1 Tax=Pararobbsia alpina TaxID=621374 RepID=UPI0039A665D6
MPYLQLDVPYEYTPEQKKTIARRMGQIYSDVMKVNANIITVTIREVGQGGVWRCSDDEPDEAAIMMLDIRRGRPIEQRAELARQLIAACIEVLGLKENRLNVEFTQHTGDEMYHPILGGFNKDWIADERAE